MITTVSGRISPTPNMRGQISMKGGSFVERFANAGDVLEGGVKYCKGRFGESIIQIANVKGADLYEQVLSEAGKTIGEKFIYKNGYSIEKKINERGETLVKTTFFEGEPLVQKHYDRIKGVITRFVFGQDEKFKIDYFKMKQKDLKVLA